MKRFIHNRRGLWTICLCFLALWRQEVQAVGPGPKPKHYISVSASGGYSFPLGDFSGVNTLKTSDWQLHLAYEMKYQRFLMQAGVGLGYRSANLIAADYQTTIAAFDTQGSEMRYTYSFTNRHDHASLLAASVPLLAGVQYTNFYFLAGVVGTFTFYQKNDAWANVTCRGLYDRYIDEFEQMENHAFYTNEQLHLSANTSYLRARIQVSPHLEVGAVFPNADEKERGFTSYKQSGLSLRIAAFAEYGLLNAQTSPDYIQPYIVNEGIPYDVNAIFFPPVFNADYYAGSALRDITVGVRVTLAFNLNTKNPYCIICR